MTNSNLPNKILLVDSDQSVVNSITAMCQKHKINVVSALKWENAVYLFNQQRFEICIVELDFKEMSGATLLQKWRHHEVAIKRDVAFILSLGKPQNPGQNALAMEIGDTLFMQKPVKEPQLIGILAKAFAVKKQREQLSEIQEKLIRPLIRKGDVDALKQLATSKLKTMGVRGQELAAEVLEQIKEIEGAIGEFRELKEAQPKNMRYMNEIGRLRLEQGNLDQAKAAFEEADRQAPDNIKRLRDMAKMYLMLDLPDDSVKKFEQILDADPSAHESDKFDMFEELQSFGYQNHAAELCQKTTAPLELIRHYNNKGVVHSKSESYVDAIDEYQKAQKLIPESKELYRILFNEAIAHMNLKDESHLQTAAKLINRCLELKPKYDKALEKQAQLKKLGYE